ncbi:MAG TPA: sugar transferase, partial [Thermoguttaceae bacterium]|nr:sugar transferase [Thermoguttaceae bacterium]
MLKRLLDIAGSLFGILLTWPIWAAAAVWIKLNSPGPVFYRGWRVGRGGKLFRIFKFRTMVVDAERT